MSSRKYPLLSQGEYEALAAFLAARLDDDERLAQDALPHWGDDAMEWEDLGDEVYAHARYHDPARVLADVAADRELLRVYSVAGTIAPGNYKFGYCEALGRVIQIRTARFSGHQDYKESWGQP